MLASLSLVAVAALAASPALAKSDVGLAYEAPDGCPTQPEFVAAVATRGAAFAGSATDGAHRVMVVAIRAEDGGFAGALQVRDDQTATNKREVHGPTCAEVVDALAVVTAIALRPADTAATQATPAGPAPVQPLPSAVPKAAPPAAAREERLRGSTMVYHHEHENVDVGPGTISFDLARTLTFYGGVTSGSAPSMLMPRFDVSMDGANFVTTPNGSQRILGLVFRYRASFLGPATYRATDTSTRLIGFTAAVGACGTPHYDSAGLVLLFCVEYGIGDMWLRTTGADGKEIQSKRAGIGLVDLDAEARYNVGSLFHVGLKAGWDAPLAGWSAERADGSRILGSSANAGYVLLGLGFRF
jgi:hypothetical protein